MPIETDLSVSPYFDEAAAGLEKNYYKVLFKPSVPVQVRELNELQSILQNQIEEFGDNLLKKGTIIRGCTFGFYDDYKYVKIKDSQPDGAPVNVSALANSIVSTSGNHEAVVLDYAEGFESTDPDVKTLYLRYTNSGTNGNNTAYSPGDVLFVRDPDYGVTNVVIGTAGVGYSNSDAVVFVSAVAVTNVNGTLTNGMEMTQPNTGANAVIVSIDSSTYKDKTILVLRPLNGDLADSTKSANSWTFSTGDDNAIRSSSNSSITAVPVEIIGSGTQAVVTTDSTGRVTDISMTSFGSSYYAAPFVTVRSTSGGSGVSLTAQNYKARVTVYDGANAVGSGYGFGVSDGVIYQKGYFLNVPRQTVVVSKYNRLPNNVSVGFSTEESIVDAFEDTELLDNALGSRNFTAPGADRLQLTPRLEVVATDVARSNLEFFSIVEFSEGVPYKQSQRTVYNGVNDEMAERTADSSGDFVTDPFLVACKSTSNASMRANTFVVVVDPGTAYIDGYRVQTYGNYQFTLNKGIDTDFEKTANVSLTYGSYVVVNELAGSFDFSAVGTVNLYDAPRNYVSTANLASATITSNGALIGTAKVRSIVYADSSTTATPQGNPNSNYHMYLFDIQMEPGRSFRDVKSIFYDNPTHKGIADVVLDNITTAGATTVNTATGELITTQGAVLKKVKSTDGKPLNKMIFYSGFDSPLAINNISYQYRTFDDTGVTYTMPNTGIISITLSGSEYFPYNTDLSDSQKQQLVFMPLTTALANVSSGGVGNAVVNSTNSIVTSSNASFTASLRIGDYVKLSGNSTENIIRRVVSIAPNTSITLDSVPGFTNATSTVTRAFPKYVPLPILTRDGITATATTNGRTLTVNLGTRLDGSSNIPLAASFNISVANSSITTKTPNRNLYTKIYPANNDTGFGYSEYGAGVNGTFTSGSNAVTVSSTSEFTAGQKVKIIQAGPDFLATVGTVTNSTHMTLANAVNFSGTADIYAAINLNGPWCLGVPDIFRLRAVYMANTSSVNTNSTDVTRDFFIDHNHNPNFASLGYLVKKKTSKLVIGPRDYLLVRYDAFTRSHEDRPVIVNSYVDSNKTTRANNDAKPLADLNNTIVNTLEIPELNGPGGTFYDMISHIDFRPSVANTANLSTTVAGATINPAFSEAFSATNKKFPVADSIMSFDTEYFKGRIDTVYVSSDGRIGTVKGRSYQTKILNGPNPDGLLTPIPTRNAMILNHIKIPAYPSIEENSDRFLNQIIAKNVINDVLLNERMNTKKISTLLDDQEIKVEQPRRYSMEDIGGLERRIKDLEYYVSLNLLELSIKDLKLPSSLSSNINRFKYGFFADSLDDLKYTDINSIEYKASIDNGRAVPSFETVKKIIDLPDTVCEFTDYSVVSQTKATGRKEERAICIKENEFIDYDSGSAPGRLDVRYVTMASDLAGKTGKVTLYAYIYGGSLNTGPVRVFQSKVQGQFPDPSDFNKALYTAADSKALTSSDVTYLRSQPGSTFQQGDSFKKNGTSHGKVRGDSGEIKLKRGGKITWNHNPANGNYYMIVISENGFRARLEYPVNVDCNEGNPPGGGGGKYNGSIKVVDQKTQGRLIDQEAFGFGTESWNARFNVFHLEVKGLKPSTKHKLLFDKVDLTHLCDTSIRTTVVPKPPKFAASDNTWASYNAQIPDFFNDSPAGTIMSDQSGKIELLLYVLSNYSYSRSERVEGAIYGKEHYRTTSYTETLNKPTIEVQNDDKSSYAYVVVKGKVTVFSGVSTPKRVG